jgi:hypothetical protein
VPADHAFPFSSLETPMMTLFDLCLARGDVLAGNIEEPRPR